MHAHQETALRTVGAMMRNAGDCYGMAERFGGAREYTLEAETWLYAACTVAVSFGVYDSDECVPLKMFREWTRLALLDALRRFSAVREIDREAA